MFPFLLDYMSVYISLYGGDFTYLLSYLFILATPCGMWDLSSPTRNQIHAPCNGSPVLTTGPPGNPPKGVSASILEGAWGERGGECACLCVCVCICMCVHPCACCYVSMFFLCVFMCLGYICAHAVVCMCELCDHVHVGALCVHVCACTHMCLAQARGWAGPLPSTAWRDTPAVPWNGLFRA